MILCRCGNRGGPRRSATVENLVSRLTENRFKEARAVLTRILAFDLVVLVATSAMALQLPGGTLDEGYSIGQIPVSNTQSSH